jgi:hypothetical protein
MKRLMFLLFVVSSAWLMAQPQDRPLGRRQGERVEQFKKIRLMDALKLDEETSIRFFAKYNKHQETMRDINMKREGMIDQLQALRKSGSSDAELEKVIKELIGMDAKVTEARTKFLDDLKTVLSVKQIVDYLVFERNFLQNIRQLMQEFTQERRQGLGPR